MAIATAIKPQKAVAHAARAPQLFGVLQQRARFGYGNRYNIQKYIELIHVDRIS
jgi:hypothetical protein